MLCSFIRYTKTAACEDMLSEMFSSLYLVTQFYIKDQEGENFFKVFKDKIKIMFC